MQRKPDITKANKELNWFPEVTLEEGLKKQLNGLKNLSIKNIN